MDGWSAQIKLCFPNLLAGYCWWWFILLYHGRDSTKPGFCCSGYSQDMMIQKPRQNGEDDKMIVGI